MDLEQRYTEENNYFQFDDYFFEALKDFSSEEIKSIIKQELKIFIGGRGRSRKKIKI